MLLKYCNLGYRERLYEPLKKEIRRGISFICKDFCIVCTFERRLEQCLQF